MSPPWKPVNDLSIESENLPIKRVDQIKSFHIFKLLNNHWRYLRQKYFSKVSVEKFAVVPLPPHLPHQKKEITPGINSLFEV